eukprot:10770386-Karenia_brevis.AAC.1
MLPPSSAESLLESPHPKGSHSVVGGGHWLCAAGVEHHSTAQQSRTCQFSSRGAARVRTPTLLLL